MLCCDREGEGIIVCTEKLPGAQRLEFDAKSRDPCDLTGLLSIDGRGHESGHFFGFGSESNTCPKLLARGTKTKLLGRGAFAARLRTTSWENTFRTGLRIPVQPSDSPRATKPSAGLSRGEQGGVRFAQLQRRAHRLHLPPRLEEPVVRVASRISASVDDLPDADYRHCARLICNPGIPYALGGLTVPLESASISVCPDLHE